MSSMNDMSAVAPPAYLSGPLVSHLDRRLRSEGEAELSKTFGLRPRHLVALTLLREFGQQSQADLARTLQVDPTSLVGLLNELEAAGLVERRRIPRDRRRHTVALTTAGIGRLAEIELALAASEQHVLSGLDPTEQATLHALLQKATGNTTWWSDVSPTDCGTDQ
jgi:MarR family transcriptional regulator, transcriptional regulator for hemolysin